MVVLFASDLRVASYAKKIQNTFLENGVDVNVRTHLPNNAIIKTHHLADLIATARADALCVIGDRNMRNRTVQAKRKGRLSEMQLDELMQGIWDDWREDMTSAPAPQPSFLAALTATLSATTPAAIAAAVATIDLSPAVLDDSLARYTGVRHINERVQRVDAQRAALERRSVNPELAALQKNLVKLHQQLVAAREKLVATKPLASAVGGERGTLVAVDHDPRAEPRQRLTAAMRDFLVKQLDANLAVCERTGKVLDKLSAPMWHAYRSGASAADVDAIGVAISATAAGAPPVAATAAVGAGAPSFAAVAAAGVASGNAGVAVVHHVGAHHGGASNSHGATAATGGNAPTSVASSAAPATSAKAPDTVEAGKWKCAACTFANNDTAQRCEMCETPRPVDEWLLTGTAGKEQRRRQREQQEEAKRRKDREDAERLAKQQAEQARLRPPQPAAPAAAPPTAAATAASAVSSATSAAAAAAEALRVQQAQVQAQAQQQLLQAQLLQQQQQQAAAAAAVAAATASAGAAATTAAAASNAAAAPAAPVSVFQSTAQPTAASTDAFLQQQAEFAQLLQLQHMQQRQYEAMMQQQMAAAAVAAAAAGGNARSPESDFNAIQMAQQLNFGGWPPQGFYGGYPPAGGEYGGGAAWDSAAAAAGDPYASYGGSAMLFAQQQAAAAAAAQSAYWSEAGPPGMMGANDLAWASSFNAQYMPGFPDDGDLQQHAQAAQQQQQQQQMLYQQQLLAAAAAAGASYAPPSAAAVPVAFEEATPATASIATPSSNGAVDASAGDAAREEARRKVREKYAGRRPPDRQCCYCGEESSLECNLCAKAGLATFFCSPTHQSLMWSEHMQAHRLHEQSRSTR